MNVAILLSGGTGTRLGSDRPKQYIEVNNQAIICYALQALAANSQIDGIQIVAATEWQDYILKQMDVLGREVIEKFIAFSLPGDNRQLSILSGLNDLQGQNVDKVLVHDAARPFLSQKMLEACLDIPDGYDGVMPVLPMKDTVYLSQDGTEISQLLDRSKIYAGQAPEGFRYEKYWKANNALSYEEIMCINGSSEPAIKAGMKIAMVPGEDRNFKITTREDLLRFQQILER